MRRTDAFIDRSLSASAIRVIPLGGVLGLRRGAVDDHNRLFPVEQADHAGGEGEIADPNRVTDHQRLDIEVEVLRQRFIVEIQLSGNQTLRYDKSLTGTDLSVDQADLALLRRLEWARGRLDAAHLIPWIPAVGFNLAACSEHAMEVDEVAAYPGKITALIGALKHRSTPMMGASSSLATLLMDVRDQDPDRTAILNLRAPANDDGLRRTVIDRVVSALGWSMVEAPRGRLQDGVGEIDLVLDTGGFGWEPGLYVLGHHPLDVVDRANRLIAVLKVTEAAA